MTSNTLQRTVPELLEFRAKSLPDCPAVGVRGRSSTSWDVLSWQEFACQVRRTAAVMQALALRPGDRVAIVARTSFQWHLVEHAALYNGAVVVGVDPHMTSAHIEGCLTEIRPRMLFVDEDSNSLSTGTTHSIPVVICLSHGFDLNWKQFETAECVESTAAGPQRGISPNALADQSATVIYTSGTTGAPKGIQFTHSQLMMACGTIQEAFPEMHIGDATLCWLPMAHLFQRMMNLVAMAQGATTYFVDDPLDVVNAAREVNPTVLIGVPRFFEKLHDQIEQGISSQSALKQRLFRSAIKCAGAVRQRKERDEEVGIALQLKHWYFDRLILAKIRGCFGRRIKFLVSGAAPLSMRHLTFFADVGCPILEAYGTSENIVPMAANRRQNFRLGSVGLPFPENEIRIADDGEVLVRGPGVSRSYLGGSHESFLRADGFFCTGDLGYLDDDGYLHLRGRKSEVVKTSTGRKVSLTKTEATYRESHYINQVCVVGEGRPYLVALCTLNWFSVQTWLKANGHQPLRKGEDPSRRSEVFRLLERELSRHGASLDVHARCARFAVIPEDFSIENGELTHTLKLRRSIIYRLHAKTIEELYRDEPSTASAIVEPMPTQV